MKKMILLIGILLAIFVGMVIYKKQEIKNKSVNANEVEQIETYISKIYMWKEITGEALPKFEDINQAPDKWIWEVIKNNLDEYQVTKEQIQEKAKEIFGEDFTKEFPQEGTETLLYEANENRYIASETSFDKKEDSFFINKINKNKDTYTVEIVEYLEDYSNVDNLTEEELQKSDEELKYDIYIENLEEEKIETLKSNESETKVIEAVKQNIEKFTKKTLTLHIDENKKIKLQKVN